MKLKQQSLRPLLAAIVLSFTAANIQAQENDNGGHRGLDFTISPGYNINTAKGGDGSISAEVSLGKRFNRNFYWGITSGALIATGSGSEVKVPITTDFKILFPLNDKTFTPGFSLRGGYVLSTSGGSDVTVDSPDGPITSHVDAADFIMIQAMPTLNLALSSSVDFIFGAGYTHYIAAKGGGGHGAITLSAAFNFHKSTTQRTRARKQKDPTRDRGIELTLEGNMGLLMNHTSNCTNPGGNIVASYKLRPNLNVGLGFGLSASEDKKIAEWTDSGSEIETQMKTKRLFVRGEYALNAKKFTPFVSCDFGLNMYSYANDSEMLGSEEIAYLKKKSGLYVSPAVGASLRVNNNSYWKLRVGYQLTSAGKQKVEIKDGEEGELKYNKLTQPYLSIGYTHTFSWGSKWFK